MIWTTPADVRAQVQKLWDNGRLLCDAVGALDGSHELETHRLGFPLTFRLRGPTPRELATRHDEVRAWIRELEAGSRVAVGFGYDIVWSETSNRVVGRNRIPSSIIVPTRTDALALIGQTETAGHFAALAKSTIDRFPELGSWLQQRPLKVLEHEGAWERILAVLDWLRDNPRSGRYVREIDVPGVDTKFIEVRKPLLAELLDLVLPAAAIDSSRSGSADFEARYGLAAKPALLRIRVLDPNLAIHGLTDLTVRIEELARLDLAVERVLIVENEITGLALPNMTRTAVTFGLGYAVGRLRELEWLRDRETLYWGDIDTNGFAMLDRMRAILPDVRSLLMDRDTLIRHQAHWSAELTPYVSALDRLTPMEASLYDDLRFDRLGRAIRLEQERIPLREAAAILVHR
ncbi:MAG: DUF2220 family protein [Hyphomicrobium sp.]|nr:DUF2220 family protein [Hyphomicrobium sp.]